MQWQLGLGARTLCELLDRRAERQPEGVAFTFSGGGSAPDSVLTYRELDLRARQVAGVVGAAGSVGDRVLLMYPPGLDYISAFFGVLYAGRIAVPVFPPTEARTRTAVDRLLAVAHDSGARLGLCLNGEAFGHAQGDPLLSGIDWLSTQELATTSSGAADVGQAGPGTIAFLQYTSGSTGVPKGVMVSHANLLGNLAVIANACGYDAETTSVSWLPLYHDMGLIGCVLEPIYGGFSQHLFSPLTFLRRPVAWLEAITRVRATTSAAPNFAFDLCLDRVTDADLERLDLSCWKTALNGAEPIRADTIERFARRFGAAGFSAAAMYPCYGLAEATLMVTGDAPGRPPVIERFDAESLRAGRARPARDGRALVGCGRPQPGQDVAIVDAGSGRPLPEFEIGEVWVAGPCVSPGYWGRADETEATFGNRLAGDRRRWLRTGDRGFLAGGELYFAGRVKDLLVVRGRNHAPQDVEATIEGLSPGVKRGAVAVFDAADDDQAPRVCAVIGLDRQASVDTGELARQARAAVASEHGIQLAVIAFTRSRSIPKTSSGKIRRQQCLAMLRDGSLEVVAQWSSAPWSRGPWSSAPPGSSSPGSAAGASPSAAGITAFLRSCVASVTGAEPEAIDVTVPYSELGLDSASALGIVGKLEEFTGRALSGTFLMEHPSIAASAAAMAGGQRAASRPRGAGREREDGVAIVGMACRMPGASSPAELWSLLTERRCAVGDSPADRTALPAMTGGFIDGVRGFDCGFFRLSKRDAAAVDPQQRLLLELAWEALEDAAIRPDELSGARVGVFIGISSNDYADLFGRASVAQEAVPWSALGQSHSIAANRISYFFGFRGPSMAVDTACSSSAVATHLAACSLMRGECDLALAGGANLILSPRITEFFTRAGALAPDGRCKAFDSRGNGFVRGEGGGVLLLRRTSDAVEAGDSIYAVIRGSAVNNDGATNGIMSPSREAQQSVIEDACAVARIDPADLAFVEAHGSGTALGDAVELGALGAVVGRRLPDGEPCLVGSVKTNLGHLEAAAGMAGIIKASLALRHRLLPASLFFREPNPQVDTVALGLRVAGAAERLPGSASLAAGVSSFGFGGTNAHLVLTPAPSAAPSAKAVLTSGASPAAQPEIFVVSGASERARQAVAAGLRDRAWGATCDESPADFARTLASGRAPLPARAAFVGTSWADADAGFAAIASGAVTTGLYLGTVPLAGPPAVAFVFSGQGGQWPGMAAGLIATEPVVAATIEHCDHEVRRLAGWSPLEALGAPGREPRAGVEQAQILGTIVQLAITELWRSWGVEPAAVCGQSAGEVAAAYAAGAVDVRGAMELIVARSALCGQTAGAGAMIACEIDGAQADALVARYAGRVVVAAWNGPRSVVLSGELAAVSAIGAELESMGRLARVLDVGFPGHGAAMRAIAPQICDALAGVRFARPRVPFFASTTGGLAVDLDAPHWAANIAGPVRFDEALRGLLGAGVGACVEIGPHPLLTPLVRQAATAVRPDLVAVGSLARDSDGRTTMLDSAARLFAAGCQVDVPATHRTGGRRITLPAYPWQRTECWFETSPAAELAAPAEPPGRWRVDWRPSERPAAIDVAALDGGWSITGDKHRAELLRAALAKWGVTADVGTDRTAASSPNRVYLPASVPDQVPGTTEVAVAARALCHELSGMLSSVPAKDGRLFLVTVGASGAARSLVDPAHAALAGMWRALALEDRRVHRSVDMPAGAEFDADRLAQVLLAEQQPSELALRGSQSFAPYLTPDTAAGPAPLIRPDATYLITGGLGAIGSRLAGWLVDRGARCLVLAGRRSASELPASAHVHEAVRLARAAGARVVTVACDLADREKCPAALEAALAGLPPVRGVIHAAGEVRATAAAEVTSEDLALAFAAKADGVAVLWGLARGWDLDFFLAMTSIAGIWGSKLLSSYAAANAFVDGFAGALRGLGAPAATIAWGPWADIGMVAGGWTEAMAAIGVRPFAASSGLAALDAGIGPGTTVSVNADWLRFASLYRMAVPGTTLFDLVAPADTQPAPQPAPEAAPVPPMSAAVAELAGVLGEDPAAIDLSRPLVSLGFDSITALELKTRLERRLGQPIASADLLADAPVSQILARIIQVSPGSPALAEAQSAPAFRARPASRYEPFPLNDIQLAYWVGRTDSFWLGEVSTHLYLEIENSSALDLSRLELAVNHLIQRHDMLRATVGHEGQQAVLEAVPPYRIRRHDLSGLPGQAAEGAVLAIRERLSHQVIESSTWPLFEFAVTELPDGRTRLHVSLDALIVDGASLLVLGRDLMRLYEEPERELPPVGLTFRDVALWQRQAREGPGYERSLAYWRERVTSMPAAPQLPLAKSPDQVRAPRFTRRQWSLGRDRLVRLRERCDERALTPSMAICAAFARVLAAWSTSGRFVLNVTLFHRPAVHPAINDVVGDFTSLLPFEIDARPDEPFEVFTRGLQDRLHRDLEHREVSGVRILRELAQVRGGFAASAMPVVFTSLLQHGEIDLGWLGEIVHSITQTPQVYLDHQISLLPGELVITWDSVDEIFPSGLVDAMFGAYVAALSALTDPAATAWQGSGDELCPASRPLRAAGPAAGPADDDGLLHGPFESWAAAHPGDLAIVAGERQLTYGQVLAAARSLAHQLLEADVPPGGMVPVLMTKGWEQVVGALAASIAGAAYVPLDPAWPPARIRSVLARVEATVALVQPGAGLTGLAGLAGLAAGVRAIEVHPCLLPDGRAADPIGARLLAADAEPVPSRAQASGLAYVIFTSGTTGEPKGVMIEHRAALNTITAINAMTGIGPGDRVLGLSGLSFDLSVWDMFGALGSGATLVVPEASAVTDPASCAEVVAEAGITIWNSVPALAEMYAEYTEGAPELHSEALRLFLLSGDWIPVSLPDRLRKLAPKSAVISLGGATEASIWSVCYPIERVDPRWRSVPYGQALPGQSVAVLNDALRPCPDWVEGEIYIGGVGVARGYLGDPELTGAKFITHPVTSQRLYRTGDRGRWLPDGNVEILGRTDHQVKIGGYRIELGEIEHHLRQHPGVGNAIVLSVRLASGATRLVGYVTPARADRPPRPADLTGALAAVLPGYMVPSQITVTDRLPVTANGKVDRARLSAQVVTEATAPGEPPRDEVTETIERAWTELLGLGAFDPGQSFLAAGGDSLIGTRFVARLRDDLSAVVPIQALFDAPDFPAFCDRVRACLAQDEVSYPATGMQRQLFVLQEAQPRSAAYNMAVCVEIAGPLDPGALRQALEQVVARHGPLRSRLLRHSGGVVVVERAAIGSVLGVTEPVRDAARALALIEAEARTPFDLAADALVRAVLVPGAGDRHWLGLCFHHCVADGWSLGVVLAELGAFYLDPRAELPLTATFAGYAARAGAGGGPDARESSRKFWREQLAGVCLLLSLPAERAVTGAEVTPAGYATTAVSGGLVKLLSQAAINARATVFNVITAAFAVVIGRLAMTTDFLIGTPVAGRSDRPAEALVGCFVTTVPLRVRLEAAQTVADLARQVRDATAEAQAHADLPFDELVSELDAPRPPGRSPVVQVMIAMQNTPLPPMKLGDLALSARPVTTGAAQFDLQLIVAELGDSLTLTVEYAADRFSESLGESTLDSLVRVLEQAAEDHKTPLSALRLTRDSATVLCGPPAEGAPRPVPELFDAVARDRRNAVAVVDPVRSVRYSELRDRSAELAQVLREHECGPGSVVALRLPRGADFVIAMLAVLRTGAAFCPIDLSLPAARQEKMMTSAGARVVLRAGEAATGPAGPVGLTADDRDGPDAGTVRPGAEAPAYVIHTSGSTGKPKAAVVTSGGLVNHLLAKLDLLELGPADRVAQTAPTSFDVFIWQMLAPLLAGGTCVCVADEVAFDPRRLMRHLNALEITVWEAVPSLLARSLDECRDGAGFPSALRYGLSTGEPLSGELARRWFEVTGVPLINAYGPAECADDVTHHVLRQAPPAGELRVPVGSPIRGVELAVVDAHGSPVPPGFPGQLVVSGPAVGLGYRNNHRQTKARFLVHPETGTRSYLTGDVARITDDGIVDLIGRQDDQLKVRGARIEAGEVEAVIAAHPSVGSVAVTAHGGNGDGSFLAAHVTWRAGRRATFRELSRHAARHLPRHAVPARWQERQALPLTASGKVDKAVLAPPDPLAPSFRRGEESRLREWICGQWTAHGGEEGRWHDFFVAGGDSFGAAGLVGALRENFSVDVSLSEFFADPSVDGLLDALLTSDGPAAQVPAEADGRADGRLSGAQEQIWIRHQLDPADPAFNIPVALHLTGDVQADGLVAAFRGLCAEHEALRRALRQDAAGTPSWAGRGEPAEPDLRVIDVGEESDPWQAAIAQARRLASTPVDLAAGTYHACLIRCAQDSYLLVIVLHHIVADGWSMGLLLEDFARRYREAAGDHPGGEGHSGDRIVHDESREWIAGAGSAVLSAATLDGDLVAALRRRHGATTYMIMTALWVAATQRLMGSRSVRLAVPIGLRGDSRTHSTVGLFVRTRLLDIAVDDGLSFRELLAGVRAELLAAYLADETAPDGTDLRDVDAMVVLQAPLPQVRMPRMSIRQVRLHSGAAKYPATLFLDAQEAGIDVLFEFARTGEWADLAGQVPWALGALLRAAAADPDRAVGALPLLGDEAADPVASMTEALARPIGQERADD